MNNLNANEIKALEVICHDCDDLDGEGFTRPGSVITKLLAAFDNNAKVAGGYLTQLIKKGYVQIDTEEDEIWITREVFEKYC